MDYENDFKNDCNDYEYIPHILKQTTRTIAIGDIHGDLDLAVNVLIIAKCIKRVDESYDNKVTLFNKKYIKEYYTWIGDDTQVVQVGDQIDRCRPINEYSCMIPMENDEASDMKILYFYTDLNKLARKANGRIISLLGNHELMNVMGNMSYVSFMGLLEFNNLINISNINYNENLNEYIKQGLINRKNEFNINNQRISNFLACTRISAIIIGDLLFIHGGMIEKMAKAYNIEDLNIIVRKWLLGKINDKIKTTQLLLTKNEKNKSNVKFNINDRLNTILQSNHSIFWNRLFGKLPADIDLTNNKYKKEILSKCNEYLKSVFNTYKIKGLIIGHTPQISDKYGINSTCEKRVWRVDIASSNAFDELRSTKKRIEVLEIKYNNNNKPIFTILKL
jgi:hypothetical protein